MKFLWGIPRGHGVQLCTDGCQNNLQSTPYLRGRKKEPSLWNAGCMLSGETMMLVSLCSSNATEIIGEDAVESTRPLYSSPQKT